MDIYETTMFEVAEDLGLSPTRVHGTFGTYLVNPEKLKPEEICYCYALYRITKLREGMTAMKRSRTLWKERALAEGWDGDEEDPWDELLKEAE